MFTEASGGAAEAQKQGAANGWSARRRTSRAFSATAYFFGKNLHAKLNQPVGLVVSCVGGTPIESWISPEAQRTLPEMKARFDALDATDEKLSIPPPRKPPMKNKSPPGKKPPPKRKPKASPLPARRDSPAIRAPRAPGNLFNGKIAPLIGYAIKGAIWYQGESNAFSVEGGKLYAKQLPLLVQDWRTRWGQGDFAFAWVQLPNFSNARFLGWREVRESMLKSLSVPNTGMAITLDLGEPGNIHPADKQGVGQRLALWALAKVYGQDIPHSGPLPKGHEIKGGEIVVSFDHAEGLQAKGGGDVIGFQIAGEDKQWHPATARIDGAKIIVSSPGVAKAAAVRYAWEDDPKFNLYNAAGIPASPFRTDDW